MLAANGGEGASCTVHYFACTAQVILHARTVATGLLWRSPSRSVPWSFEYTILAVRCISVPVRCRPLQTWSTFRVLARTVELVWHSKFRTSAEPTPLYVVVRTGHQMKKKSCRSVFPFSLLERWCKVRKRLACFSFNESLVVAELSVVLQKIQRAFSQALNCINFIRAPCDIKQVRLLAYRWASLTQIALFLGWAYVFFLDSFVPLLTDLTLGTIQLILYLYWVRPVQRL